MRDFAEIQRELKLVPFVESPNGMLYAVPIAPGVARMVVRHFDGALPPLLVPAYVSLLRASQAWLEADQQLSRVVRLELPVEVGLDFIARPHHLGTSLKNYASDEDPPEAPPELPSMLARFATKASEATSASERLITRVLAKSILEPTSKTRFSFDEDRFVIVDLKPTRQDLEDWAALDASGHR